MAAMLKNKHESYRYTFYSQFATPGPTPMTFVQPLEFGPSAKLHDGRR
jgi:hypothetical protein